MVDLLDAHGDLEPIGVSTTAVLLLDLQEICVEQWTPTVIRPELLKNAASLLAWARRLGLNVIHVKVAFRAGYPEISPRNKLFMGLKTSGLFPVSGEGCDFHEAVQPLAQEAVVTKHRVGAFTGTDLDMILRSRGITTLILSGISTTGAVLSAVRQAFDLDFRLIVPTDCCADPDLDLHQIVMNKIIANHATVTRLENLKAIAIL